jgi:hypothetical protein
VSLYRVRRAWGYSYPWWTPFAVQLETLYVDAKVAEPEAFKQTFITSVPGDLVHEFLYLQGGTTGGSWTWGRVGSVNAPLLWPDALRYFVKCIAPHAGLNVV